MPSKKRKNAETLEIVLTQVKKTVRENMHSRGDTATLHQLSVVALDVGTYDFVYFSTPALTISDGQNVVNESGRAWGWQWLDEDLQPAVSGGDRMIITAERKCGMHIGRVCLEKFLEAGEVVGENDEIE